MMSKPKITRVKINAKEIDVRFDNGSRLKVPLAVDWELPSLSKRERDDFRLVANGTAMHWPEFDIMLTAEDLLRGALRVEREAEQARRILAEKKAAS